MTSRRVVFIPSRCVNQVCLSLTLSCSLCCRCFSFLLPLTRIGRAKEKSPTTSSFRFTMLCCRLPPSGSLHTTRLSCAPGPCFGQSNPETQSQPSKADNVVSFSIHKVLCPPCHTEYTLQVHVSMPLPLSHVDAELTVSSLPTLLSNSFRPHRFTELIPDIAKHPALGTVFTLDQTIFGF